MFSFKSSSEAQISIAPHITSLCKQYGIQFVNEVSQENYEIVYGPKDKEESKIEIDNQIILIPENLSKDCKIRLGNAITGSYKIVLDIWLYFSVEYRFMLPVEEFEVTKEQLLDDKAEQP